MITTLAIYRIACTEDSTQLSHEQDFLEEYVEMSSVEFYTEMLSFYRNGIVFFCMKLLSSFTSPPTFVPCALCRA